MHGTGISVFFRFSQNSVDTLRGSYGSGKAAVLRSLGRAAVTG